MAILLAPHGAGQNPAPSKLKLDTGKDIFEAACVACHGVDGRGQVDAATVFPKPKTFLDFTACDQTTPELNVDWKATIRDGGHGRGFSPIMPSFSDALSDKDIDKVIDYLRGFCTEKKWPRGEFNLPLALVTEKAFPENETVLTGAVNVKGSPEVGSDLIYEKRFGARTQLEIDVPIGVVRNSPGVWYGGIGDATIGLKQVLFANLKSGSILSGFGGIVVPSGSSAHGLGSGTAAFETFAAYAQLLPRLSFIQLQAGTEQPGDTAKAPRNAFWRGAFGKSFRQSGGVGRMWTPMVEFVASHDFGPEPVTDWDVIPQFQVTLSQRQHVRLNLGLRIPATKTTERPVQAMFYLIWDWFDGGLREGWR